MNVRLLLTGACVTLGVAGGFLLAAVPATSPATSPALAGLKAEVVPATQTAKPGETISTAFRITNAGPTTQIFQVYSCSWPTEWKPGNPALTLFFRGCSRNGLTRQTLAPGEKWESAGNLVISPSAPAGALTATFTFTEGGGRGTIQTAPITLTVSAAK